MLDEALESTLFGSRIGLEDPHVLVELPIVAILHAAEQPAPDTDLLKWHEAVRLMEHGKHNGNAPLYTRVYVCLQSWGQQDLFYGWR